MKKIKHGFTLAEMLVVLGVIVFLLTILVPVMKKVTPNQDKMMLKKAYYMAERVINELVNDTELYPEPDDPVMGDWFLANTKEVRDPRTGNMVSGPTKFCELFKARMNVLEEHTTCENSTGVGMGTSNVVSVANQKVTFTTTDGVDWYIRKGNFTGSTYIELQIDVSGRGKGNDCFYLALDSPGKCLKPDSFWFKVYSNGRIEPYHSKTLEWLTDTKVTN